MSKAAYIQFDSSASLLLDGGDVDPKKLIPRKGTLLVVDDDPMFRQLLVKSLKDDGYEIVEAENGSAALKLLQSSSYKFKGMITDYLMPGMNGERLIRTIRKAEKESEDKLLSVIILLSSMVDFDIRLRDLGDELAICVLSKPYDKDELLGILAEF